MTETPFHAIQADGIRAVLDLRVGHVRSLDIAAGAGRTIAPLHTAPWVDDPAITEDEAIDKVLRFLSGDFFCAPFGASDLDAAPPHGWPANASWTVVDMDTREPGRVTARYALSRTVLGARLVKEFTVRDGHPFLYQRHIFLGGEGALSVANHGMTRFDAPGRLSFSPKLFGETPATASEPDPARGRSKLRYPARFTDLTTVPMADGSSADLTRYPIASAHEEFLSLIEDPANQLGWAAALRPDKRDIFITLKNPRDFPITMMWFSNGGRDYPPWNSRHHGVLGLEEGRTYAGYGHKASIAANPWTEQGIATALVLDPKGEVEVRNVLGGVPAPDGGRGLPRSAPGDRSSRSRRKAANAWPWRSTEPFCGRAARPDGWESGRAARLHDEFDRPLLVVDLAQLASARRSTDRWVVDRRHAEARTELEDLGRARFAVLVFHVDVLLVEDVATRADIVQDILDKGSVHGRDDPGIESADRAVKAEQSGDLGHLGDPLLGAARAVLVSNGAIA